MAVQLTDLLLIERSGTLYKATAADIAALASGGASVVTFTDESTFEAYTPAAGEIAVLVGASSLGLSIATQYAAYPL